MKIKDTQIIGKRCPQTFRNTRSSIGAAIHQNEHPQTADIDTFLISEGIEATGYPVFLVFCGDRHHACNLGVLMRDTL